MSQNPGTPTGAPSGEPSRRHGRPTGNRWTAAAERRLTPRSWFQGVFRQWPLLLVLAIVGTGLVVVADDHFKRGTVLIAMGVCVAAAVRAVLPDERAGVMKVRSRLIDVLTLAALGLGCLVAALIVPPPS